MEIVKKDYYLSSAEDVEIDLSLNQPLEDLMAAYYQYIDSFEDLEKSLLYEAVSSKAFIDVESYLIHMNVI
jgi:hypothetical protein